MSHTEISITGGPTKAQIIARMFGKSNGLVFKTVQKQSGSVIRHDNLEVVIFQMTKEDGSGERFIINGYTEGGVVEFYYDTKQCTGYVKENAMSAAH